MSTKAIIEIEARTKKALKKLDTIDRKINKTARTAKKTSSAFSTLGGTIKSAFVMGVVYNALNRFNMIVSESISSALDFEESLRRIQGITGVTGERLDSLADSALKVSINSENNASDVAKMGLEYIKAGRSVEEANDMMKVSNDLMTVSGEEAGFVVNMLNSTMNAFSATSDEAERYGDVIMGAVSGSAMGIQEAGEAMKFASPYAAAFGADVEATMSLIGTMADFGLKGTKGGTAVKNMFKALLKPNSALSGWLSENIEKTDTLVDLFDELEGVSSSDLAKFFDIRAFPAAQRLAGQSGLFANLRDDIVNNAGGLKDAAKEIRSSWNLQFKDMSSDVQTFITTFFNEWSKFTDLDHTPMEYISEIFTNLQEKLSENPEAFTKYFEMADSVVINVQRVLGVMNGIAKLTNQVVEGWKKINQLTGAFDVAGSALQLSGMGFDALTGADKEEFSNSLEYINDMLVGEGSAEESKEYNKAIDKALSTVFSPKVSERRGISEMLSPQIERVRELQDEFDEAKSIIREEYGKLSDAPLDVIKVYRNMRNDLSSAEKQLETSMGGGFTERSDLFMRRIFKKLFSNYSENKFDENALTAMYDNYVQSKGYDTSEGLPLEFLNEFFKERLKIDVKNIEKIVKEANDTTLEAIGSSKGSGSTGESDSVFEAIIGKAYAGHRFSDRLNLRLLKDFNDDRIRSWEKYVEISAKTKEKLSEKELEVAENINAERRESNIKIASSILKSLSSQPSEMGFDRSAVESEMDANIDELMVVLEKLGISGELAMEISKAVYDIETELDKISKGNIDRKFEDLNRVNFTGGIIPDKRVLSEQLTMIKELRKESKDWLSSVQDSGNQTQIDNALRTHEEFMNTLNETKAEAIYENIKFGVGIYTDVLGEIDAIQQQNFDRERRRMQERMEMYEEHAQAAKAMAGDNAKREALIQQDLNIKKKRLLEEFSAKQEEMAKKQKAMMYAQMIPTATLAAIDAAKNAPGAFTKVAVAASVFGSLMALVRKSKSIEQQYSGSGTATGMTGSTGSSGSGAGSLAPMNTMPAPPATSRGNLTVNIDRAVGEEEEVRQMYELVTEEEKRW